MKIIIRNAKVVSKNSELDSKIIDVKIVNGIVQEIGSDIKVTSDFEEIKIEDLHISEGWFDSSVSFGEPGFEDRETVKNGLLIAAKSGFTAVALQPNSFPVLDNQSQIQFVISKAASSATQLFPIGALTKNSEGHDLAELFDMKNSGAIAFGDYQKNIANANVLKIGLQYVQDFNGLVLAFCQDEKIKGNGVVHEGKASLRLGLKGIPTLAEEIIVSRNLFLLEYTGGKMHIPTISSSKSVDLIREAKKKGLQVTCSVAVHNLVLTDDSLTEFDTRQKVVPPLRDCETNAALIKGVLDGTIDAITSDHNPIDIEHKKMEFDLATNGTIGLESAFAALATILTIDVIIEKLTAARIIFGLDLINPFEAKSKANFTLFTTTDVWEFSKKDIKSKSKNSAFLGQKMKGKVIAIVANNQFIKND
ncbi:MAG: dihydroorotase [Flavobacterium sp.]|jgi:dihydroorotase